MEEQLNEILKKLKELEFKIDRTQQAVHDEAGQMKNNFITLDKKIITELEDIKRSIRHI